MSTYFIDGEELWIENLDADQAAAVLAGLHAEANRTSDPAHTAVLADQIREVAEWVEFLAEEAAEDAAQDAAAEHAAALYADHLAGF